MAAFVTIKVKKKEVMEPGKLKSDAALSKWLDKDSFSSVGKIGSGALIKEGFITR
jgi:hypothetical protein